MNDDGARPGSEDAPWRASNRQGAQRTRRAQHTQRTRRAWVHPVPGIAVTHSRLDHTASVILTREESFGAASALVVDPCWAPEELDALAADVRTWGLDVVAGFATHAHYDHVLWHPDLGDVPRWASPGTARLARTHAEDNRTGLHASVAGWTAELLDLVGAVRAFPTVDHLRDWAEVIVHDAHSTGHAALWLSEPQVLIAGDMLSDIEVPMFAETGAQAYLDGLQALRPYAHAAQVLIPGHGTITDQGARRWSADQRYVEDLLAGRESADPRLDTESNRGPHAHNLAALG